MFFEGDLSPERQRGGQGSTYSRLSSQAYVGLCPDPTHKPFDFGQVTTPLFPHQYRKCDGTYLHLVLTGLQGDDEEQGLA